MQHEIAHDQASLDYLKYSEFRTVIDLAGMNFRIVGTDHYMVFVDGEDGEEVTIFEGTRAAVLDFLSESDASLRACTEKARKQVFLSSHVTPWQPRFSLEQEIAIIHSIFDAGRLPGTRDQWESWCRRLWDAKPLEVCKFSEMAEKGRFLSLEWLEDWVRVREKRAVAKAEGRTSSVEVPF